MSIWSNSPSYSSNFSLNQLKGYNLKFQLIYSSNNLLKGQTLSCSLSISHAINYKGEFSCFRFSIFHTTNYKSKLSCCSSSVHYTTNLQEETIKVFHKRFTKQVWSQLKVLIHIYSQNQLYYESRLRCFSFFMFSTFK